MNQNSRYGFKWSINEILSLQREFELLGWNIDQIAEKHKRTANAIMYKLDQEGFADYNVLYTNYHNLNATIPLHMPLHMAPELSLQHDDDSESNFTNDDSESNFTNVDSESNFTNDDEHDEDDEDEDDEDEDDEDEDDDVANLSERVYGLEESVSEIRDMIKQMMSTSSKPTVSNCWF
jgi:hypothetical protein